MREFLFIGKRVDNGEWVEGFLWKKKYDTSKLFISCFPNKDDNEEVFAIDPETACQYTGLLDRNDKKLFESDIVKVCRGVDIDTGYVFYDERIGAYIIRINDTECLTLIDYFLAKQKDDRIWIEIIGNIHDNRELLKMR